MNRQICLGIVSVWMCVLVACVMPAGVPCGDRVCPAGTVCVQQQCASKSEAEACFAAQEGASCYAQGVSAGACHAGRCTQIVCGDGVRDWSEACDDGNRSGGDGCAADCKSSELCGNGIVDRLVGEQCDDGNASDADSCHRDCRLPRCGDGVVDAQFGEGCDSGSDNSDAPNHACRTDCQAQRCGDGVVDASEVCDDGNVVSRDGCAGNCLSTEVCGNGVADLGLGESCDDGNLDNRDACRNDCTLSSCGDGEVNAVNGEGCDAGSLNSNAPDAECRLNCQPRRCGDGVRDAGEVCDDANTLNADGCSGNCQSLEICGNGIVDVTIGEQCDDGNLANDDGCRIDCRVPRCGDGVVDPQLGERCDDGSANSAVADAACRPNCQVGRCGDGIVDSREVCDDGNVIAGDGCSVDCASTEVCGNGYRDAVAGEQCDDVGPVGRAGDGCSSRCRAESRIWRAIRSPMPYGVFSTFAIHPQAKRVWRLARPSFASGQLAEFHELRDLSWHQREFADMPRDYRVAVTFAESLNAVVALAEGRTWAFDGVRWRVQAPTAPSSDHPLVYDRRRSRVVSVGSAPGNSALKVIWEFDGSMWTSRQLSGQPAIAYGDNFVYHDALNAVVFYLVRNNGTEHAMWAYDGATWTPLVAPPRVLSYAKMAYDVTRDSLVITNGSGGFAFDGANWQEFVGPQHEIDGLLYLPWKQTLIAISPEGTSSVLLGGQWQQLPLDTGHEAFAQAASAFDTARRRLVVYGGVGATRKGETREWNGRWWERFEPAIKPPALTRAAMAYDERRHRIVLFGGASDAGVSADTWVWDGIQWERLAVSGPAPREGAVLFYDSVEEAVILFGGMNGNVEMGDTWRLGVLGWEELEVPGPSARAAASAVALPDGRVVLYGGAVDLLIPQQQFLADTWIWHNRTWQQQPIALGPANRMGSRMTHDTQSNTVLLAVPESGLWSLSPNHGWVLISQDPVIRDRVSPIVHFDAIRNELLVAFGLPFALTETPAATWALQWRSAVDNPEQCQVAAADTDGDGLSGCADPDCASRCTPYCALTSCAPSLPHCGDGVCDDTAEHEDYQICPADCAP